MYNPNHGDPWHSSGFADRSPGISKQMPPVRVYDFFSGCGGTSAGLSQCGMIPTVALDINDEAISTFGLNFPAAETVKADIRAVRTSDLMPFFERQRTAPVLFSACAPCQPFSKQNRQKKASDTRISLLPELTRFLRRFRPELLLVENVPGLQEFSENEDGPLHDLISNLNELGYKHAVKIVQAQHYGVPQNRRRLVLIASLFGEIEFPKPTHGEGLLPIRTVRDAVGHLPKIAAGARDDGVANHYASALSPTNLERIRSVGEGGGRRTWQDHLKLDCHKDVKGFTDVYGRMTWDKPSPALTTRCISLSNGRFGHPDQDRAISIREAACLQSFPEDFQFFGTVNGMARQIGNAVPPTLARVLGDALIEHVRKNWIDANG